MSTVEGGVSPFSPVDAVVEVSVVLVVCLDISSSGEAAALVLAGGGAPALSGGETSRVEDVFSAMFG